MKLRRRPSSSNWAALYRLLLHAIFWDGTLRARIPQYLFQCGIATGVLVVIFLVEDAVLNAAIVVAVASTAFIVFVIPNSIAATPRKVIGGHVVAVLIAGLFALFLELPLLDQLTGDSRYILDIIAAISVGISILMMVFTDTQHPPAAGTALGLVIQDFTLNAVLFILISSILLTIIRILLRPKLVNLL